MVVKPRSFGLPSALLHNTHALFAAQWLSGAECVARHNCHILYIITFRPHKSIGLLFLLSLQLCMVHQAITTAHTNCMQLILTSLYICINIWFLCSKSAMLIHYTFVFLQMLMNVHLTHTTVSKIA